MPFNKQYLITWTELSPSLQELFKFNQSQIFVERDNRIREDKKIQDAIDAEIAERKKKVAELKAYASGVATKDQDPRIAELLQDGRYMDGMVLKVDTEKGKLYADDCYRNCCVVETDAELNQMKGAFTPIDLTTVFNSWYRFAHYCSKARYETNTTAENTFLGGGNAFYQNTGPCANYINVWSHNMNSNPKSITINVDWSPTCGFVSPSDYYTNYYIRTKYYESDDDFCFILVGFCTDNQGVEHTLTIVSCSMSDTRISWAFIYDMDCPTQHIIVDNTPIVGRTGSGNHYISAKRINSSFVFKKTPTNSDVDKEEWTIRWSYPDTKPADMTQEEYDNIGKMLTIENRVGVGVTNMPCTFLIADQYAIFEEQDIYALHTDDIWSYDSSKGWYKNGKIRDKLPDRTFLYNPLLEKLVYRKYWNNWTTIKTKD